MDAPTKDVTIGDFTYQISRFGPREGSWIVGQFLKKGLYYALETNDQNQLDEKELGGLLSASFDRFPEDVFSSIQAKCLAVIKRYETLAGQTIPKPLFMADGNTYAVKPAPDLVDLTAVTVAALAFNLYCFFDPGAREKLLMVFKGESQPSAPGSTDIYSAPSSPASGITVTSIAAK